MSSYIQENLAHTDTPSSQKPETPLGPLGANPQCWRAALGRTVCWNSPTLWIATWSGSAAVMKRPMNSVGSVTGITSGIMSISSRTKLLELNASVEAASAGAAGRGFSFVAAEIRGMPAESEGFTREIEKIINEFTVLANETQTATKRRRISPCSAGGWVR